jgi:hypothetical protein
MKIILLIGIGVTMLLVFGFASAHLSQNEQTDTSIVEEPDNEQCNGLGNCERTCNGTSSGEFDGLCNRIEKRNCNRVYGPVDGTGNKGCGPRDGTGYGSKNCHK